MPAPFPHPAPLAAVLQLAVFTWPDRFHAYSTFHLVVAVTCLTLIAAACVLGLRLRHRSPDAERTLRFAWAGATLAFQLFSLVWWLLPAHYDPDRSLPLQFCRIAAFIAPVALLTEHSLLRALLFFWGLGLCSQALLTPVYGEGFLHFPFWSFWLGHIQIVGSAMYDLTVRGYRPSFRDFLTASLLGLAYAAVIIPINIAFGFDFGFLGRAEHGTTTYVSFLPAWPWRPLLVWATAQVAVALLYFAARRRGGRPRAAVPVSASADRPPATPHPSTVPLR